jgi:hypothetical protein
MPRFKIIGSRREVFTTEVEAPTESDAFWKAYDDQGDLEWKSTPEEDGFVIDEAELIEDE